MKHLGAAFAVALVAAACGGGGGGSGGGPPPPPPQTYSAASGVAQKGPLILGSTVTAQELTAALTPNGKQYSFETTSDFGTFTPNASFTSAYIGLNASGYYFDEVANGTSTGPVTLYGISDLSSTTVLNVNVLTTLAYQRVQNLVATGHMTFAAAEAQAQSEVLAAFNIHDATAAGNFDSLDLSLGTNGDHILAAISSLLDYGNTAGNLSALLANIQNDIGQNGSITNAATKTTLAASARALDPAAVAANLTAKYASLHVSFQASDISSWLDQDGDGVVGNYKFSVADASQSSSFTFAASVTDPYAGTAVSASAGQLSVNGTLVSGATTIQAGDMVSVAPPAGAFPNGVVTIYLLSGSTRVARVSFVAGLTSITVTPADSSIQRGATQQFTATGHFSDGSSADVTASVVWSSSTADATINPSTGLASGTVIGPATITATSGSISGSTSLTITAPSLVSIAISPSPFSTGVGIARQLVATGTYTDASTANLTSAVAWTSMDTTIVSVTAGLATGVGLGSTSISVSLSGLGASVPVSVTSGSWTLTAPMLVPRQFNTATVMQNGLVLVAQGDENYENAMTPVVGSETYNPSLDAWSATPEIGFNGDFNGRAVLLASGKVLVAGGEAGGTNGLPLTLSVLYDPTSNSWQYASSLPEGHTQFSIATLPNGKILAAGGGSGFDQLYGPLPTAAAAVFDPTAGVWTSVPPMTIPRALQVSASLPDGRVLVAGGLTETGTFESVTATAEVYDSSTNAWSGVAPMNESRVNGTATLLPNGLVLVAGGGSATAELYDPVANTWTYTGSMSTSRAYHTATLLPSGKVIVVGGGTAMAEIYDPATGVWSPTGSTNFARSNHAAVLLPNNVLLVCGGGGASNACELYW